MVKPYIVLKCPCTQAEARSERPRHCEPGKTAEHLCGGKSENWKWTQKKGGKGNEQTYISLGGSSGMTCNCLEDGYISLHTTGAQRRYSLSANTLHTTVRKTKHEVHSRGVPYPDHKTRPQTLKATLMLQKGDP
jgi:hypothetical protein